MGRLPALSVGAGLLARCAAGLAALSGCDSSADAPAKSRVQAVLAEPESAPGGAPPGGASASPGSITPVAEPPPAKRRAPLCDGQLAAKPQPFKPKRLPSQLSVAVSEGGAAEGGAAEGRAAEGRGSALPADPLKASRGHWTWLNFWAAWCVPCREELPLLFSWQEMLGNRVSFTFVSLDDDERQLHEFLEKQPDTGLRRTQWLPDGAVRKAWLDALGLETEPELPFQVLLDPKGMLRCKVGGAVEATDLAALEQIISPQRK